jgi:hypothetical protein
VGGGLIKWARVFDLDRIAGHLCWVPCLTAFTAFLLLLRIIVVRFTYSLPSTS